MSDETKTSVGGAEAPEGPRGELLMARTPKVALRLWEGEDAGERAPEHSNSYDYVAYILSGALRVTIGDAEAVEVRAGDSYAVPAQTPYSFEVLETAKVVEAVAPGDAI
jgi:quercetin dioxygenase-like cupin family protein